jgi:hypothetical protein
MAILVQPFFSFLLLFCPFILVKAGVKNKINPVHLSGVLHIAPGI